MEAKELRIGNWIYQGEKCGNKPIEAYQLYQYSLGGFISSNNIPTYYHYWKPIELTEEWLIKLGFEKIDIKGEEGFIDSVEYQLIHKDCYINYDGVDFSCVIACDLETYTDSPNYFAPDKERMQYVHQLQNLYFALTGEELTIKPTTI